MDVNIVKGLKEIKTPLAFLSLSIIVTEGLLYSLINKGEGLDLTLLTAGMVLLPFAILLIFYLLFRTSQNDFEGAEIVDESSKDIKAGSYDLFVSAPMASFENSREYEASRVSILDTIKGMKKNCGFSSVFYAGYEINSFKKFESEDLSVAEDYASLRNSSNFILIYPRKIATSALIELGWAMVMKKPIIIFVKKMDDLPYLMKHADSVYKNIAIYEYDKDSDIQDKFVANGARLFERLTSRS